MKYDNPNDKVYTPEHIVDEVLNHYGSYIKPQEIIMEPFKGGGAFYNKLHEYSSHTVRWCEIDKGVDFFETVEKVDWIITNPPYSIFKEVLPKMS